MNQQIVSDIKKLNKSLIKILKTQTHLVWSTLSHWILINVIWIMFMSHKMDVWRWRGNSPHWEELTKSYFTNTKNISFMGKRVLLKGSSNTCEWLNLCSLTDRVMKKRNNVFSPECWCVSREEVHISPCIKTRFTSLWFYASAAVRKVFIHL